VLRRTIRAIVATAALAAAVAIPGTAQADNNNITIWIDRLESNGGKTSAMVGSISMSAGDCMMNVPSFVTINPPTATGYALIQWEGWGYTRHTNNADYWNLYLNFRDTGGNFVESSPVLRGAAMTVWYQTYGWDRYTSIPMTQAQFNAIEQVQWIGTC
jgi:hypothetical protein